MGKIIKRKIIAFLTLLFISTHSQAESINPTLLGQTGLISMPSARIAEDGTMRFGLSYMDPYGALWSSISMIPRLELGARYTSISNTGAFEDNPGADFGTNKDKAFDAKLVLYRESKWIPQISIGTQDFLGTRVFDANYMVLSKQYEGFDLTLGVGNKRFKGAFGGLSYSPKSLTSWSFMTEYDAFDYANDRLATESGAINRKGGFTVGVNYQWGWLGTQLSYQDGEYGINAHLSIPLQEKEFIPKLEEPKPYTTQTTRVSSKEWKQDDKHAAALIKALSVQDFRNVRLWLNEEGLNQEGLTREGLNNDELEVGVSHPRISLVARAAGRAVRTSYLMAPTDIKSIKINYYDMSDQPIVSYRFTDLEKLDRFFSGNLTYGELLKVLKVSYSEPELAEKLEQNKYKDLQNTVDETQHQMHVRQQDEGQPITLKKTSPTLDSFYIAPINFGVFFNDPSGAFKYDLFARAYYRKYMGDALFFDTVARMRLLENVSDVTQPSNSTLPHVRTDVADYKREGGLKIEKFMLNKYFLLQPRVYARASAGIYEEMFGGVGGQLLYLPKEGSWGLDLAIDALQQRDTEGGFGFRDYKTTTAILSYHYRIKKYGLSFTLRGGQFLAKDDGVRFEFARRFRSGFKVGAWYTYTNGEDTTGPGSLNDPYYDKGVFMQIPLSSMLTKDTQAKGGFALAPWTRDVGQMVKSPGDLYEMLEEPLLLDTAEKHLLSDFHM